MKKFAAIVLSIGMLTGVLAMTATPALAAHTCVSIREWNHFDTGDQKRYVEALFGNGYDSPYYGRVLRKTRYVMYRLYKGCISGDLVRVKYRVAANAWVVTNARYFD